ncbi:MAG TPA: LysR family transcriptional regulator [Streptosporangiaceae bacterium]|jgi:DNA-binding transcriptional LysR family regulator
MADLELRHLRVVQAVADAGSLTKAAARLGVSQPALTAQLARIERMLGGRLFARGPRGAEPTALGRFIVGRAEALLADMDALLGAARQKVAGMTVRPQLRVGSTPLLMIAAFVEQLHLKGDYGQVTTLVHAAAQDVLGLLAASRIDVAICDRADDMGPQDVAGMRLRTLVHEPVLIALAQSHPLAERTMIDLADLAECDWVVPPPHDNPLRQQLLVACSTAGFVPRLRHFTNDTSTAHMLVSHGAVSLAAAASRSSDGLVVRPLAGEPLVAEILFATRSGDPDAGTADDLFRAAARAYLTTIDRNPPYLRHWWAEHPDSHAAIDLALAGES